MLGAVIAGSLGLVLVLAVAVVVAINVKQSKI
jgi:hypothetical protein